MKQKGMLFWCELCELLIPLEIPETLTPSECLRLSTGLVWMFLGLHSEIMAARQSVSCPHPAPKKTISRPKLRGSKEGPKTAKPHRNTCTPKNRKPHPKVHGGHNMKAAISKTCKLIIYRFRPA